MQKFPIDMMIGIGIITYNRLASLKRLCKSVIEYTGSPYDLWIADDGSVDGTVEWLKKEKLQFITGLNMGCGYNKNRALGMLRDHEYIFLIEDDMEIIKKGWENLYITAIQESKIQHFNFFPLKQWRDKRGPEHSKRFGTITVEYFKNLQGPFQVMTKEVVKTVGGFDPRLKIGSHIDFTNRVAMAGLTTPSPNYAAVSGDIEYLKYHQGIPSTISVQEWRKVLKQVRELSEKVQKEREENGFYHPLEVEEKE